MDRHRRMAVCLAAAALLLSVAVLAGCSGTISRNEAVAIAMETVGPDPPPVVVVTSAPPGAGPETTTTTLGVVLESAELAHDDALAITRGEDMLVWEVYLGGSTARGEVGTRVWIDAKTGRVLTWWIGP